MGYVFYYISNQWVHVGLFKIHLSLIWSGVRLEKSLISNNEIKWVFYQKREIYFWYCQMIEKLCLIIKKRGKYKWYKILSHVYLDGLVIHAWVAILATLGSGCPWPSPEWQPNQVAPICHGCHLKKMNLI